MKIGPYRIDASMTLAQLTGNDWGDPESAPTHMVATIIRSTTKPLIDLNGEEVWYLISQQDGLPFILDLAWLFLEKNPLQNFWHYEGDVLSTLLRASDSIWEKRPEYREALPSLRERALEAPAYLNDAFRESLTQA